MCLWPQNKFRSQWPIFHSPVIFLPLFFALKNILVLLAKLNSGELRYPATALIEVLNLPILKVNGSPVMADGIFNSVYVLGCMAWEFCLICVFWLWQLLEYGHPTKSYKWSWRRQSTRNSQMLYTISRWCWENTRLTSSHFSKHW